MWADLWAAVGGSDQDYTSGPVGRAILLLAVPMVLETAMESVFAVVDMFFVARLGPTAIATVALTESLLILVYTVAMGLSIGVTAMVSRRIGEGDREGAANATVQAIALGASIALGLGLIGAPFASALLGIMGGSSGVIAEGSAYTRILLATNATVLLLFLINAAFRGAGDAAIAMRVLCLANGINIVLDPMLIFGIGPFPELGIRGAAIATSIGRGAGVLLQLWMLKCGRGRLQVRLCNLRLLPPILWRLVRLSGTGTFQAFTSMASWIGLVRILAGFGDAVLAGYGIGIRLIVFALLPSWGMSNAAATMVGQALGANKPERAERAVWIAAFYNMLFLGTTGFIFFVLAPVIVAWFTPDPEVLRYGVLCLRIVSTGFVFYAYGMVFETSFNGAGDIWTPTVINLFCFWLFELPFAALLAYTFEFGAIGVFIAMTMSFSMLAVIAGIWFHRGGWKAKVL